MDGVITAADVTAFMNDVSNEAPEADLNNDGLFNQDDTDIYNAAFCGGGCAPVTAPGCSNQEDCHLADWNDDDALGVEDIFAFLSDWFAQESDAYNFGGTPGVPAIFAYLSLWFSVGAGPCDP